MDFKFLPKSRKHIGVLVAGLTIFSCAPRKTPEGSEVKDEREQILEQPTRRDSAPRIIAIGDVHGDFGVTVKALKLAGAIDNQLRWIGGKLVVVQLGDQLDRGNKEREVLDLFFRLETEAREAGGAFYPLVGNHELMNVMFDFGYVTPAGFRQFSEFADGQDNFAPVRDLEAPAKGRGIAFFPGGAYAKKIAHHNTAMIIGDTVFVHGGLLPEHAQYGIDKINRETSSWILGRRRARPAFLDDENGPLWNRSYSSGTGQDDCTKLESTLRILNAKRMIVAHTPQDGGINSRCDRKVWRVDTGLSSYYGGKLEILEIRGDDLKVLRPE